MAEHVGLSPWWTKEMQNSCSVGSLSDTTMDEENSRNVALDYHKALHSAKADPGERGQYE